MTDIKTELLKTIDHLKSIESLSNYRFELNRYESAIKVIDLWIENAHQDFDKNYAIVAKENDLYNLSFETTFDYRDTFDEKLASELISNGLKFEIYKNKLTVSRVDLELKELSDMIDYVANELRYFGQKGRFKMTIEELYECAKSKGLENRQILIADRDCMYTEFFTVEEFRTGLDFVVLEAD